MEFKKENIDLLYKKLSYKLDLSKHINIDKKMALQGGISAIMYIVSLYVTAIIIYFLLYVVSNKIILPLAIFAIPLTLTININTMRKRFKRVEKLSSL